MNTDTTEKALIWAYDAALSGLPGTQGVMELAEDYLKQSASRDAAVESLIHWQVSKAALSGFVSGLGGLGTLPLTVPAAFASSLYVQLRMVSAIAYMHGFDPRSAQTRGFAFACLCGHAVGDVLKGVGIAAGTKLSQAAVRKVSGEVLSKINKAVGFRLVTKFGSKGVVNLVRVVPIAGGLVGAAFDGSSTYAVGQAAIRVFGR